jgi:hypothetical protein
MDSDLNVEFDWQRYPETARFVGSLCDRIAGALPFVANLQQRMMRETGTQLIDWIDHLGLPASDPAVQDLPQLGFAETTPQLWTHPRGMFPSIRVSSGAVLQLAIKVESVVDFLFAHHGEVLGEPISGSPSAPLRVVRAAANELAELLSVERHGYRGFVVPEVSAEHTAKALLHLERFSLRRREFASDAEGFDHARDLIGAAIADLGVDYACDLFFAAERRYWQSRNRAARLQKARQDRLGLGWANHDHHTYRSSREHFPRLIAVLEQLGFRCRERFYGGAQSGWGAQVLEQSATGIVIFADLDLTPEEITGDFAHEGLPPHDRLGTVGLWCKLHGEAFLQAGMHHLEAQFDFDLASVQLAEAGIKTMAPFTDMEHLKQAFTEGEGWPIAEHRIDAALREGFITTAQAEKFRTHGSIGSHLEILQRWEGYKGFNQTGISEIIRDTDPRTA